MALDNPLGANDSGLALADVLHSNYESPEDRIESSLLRDDLELVVNTLTPKERDIVRMRYRLDDGHAKHSTILDDVLYYQGKCDKLSCVQ